MEHEIEMVGLNNCLSRSDEAVSGPEDTFPFPAEVSLEAGRGRFYSVSALCCPPGPGT